MQTIVKQRQSTERSLLRHELCSILLSSPTIINLRGQGIELSDADLSLQHESENGLLEYAFVDSENPFNATFFAVPPLDESDSLYLQKVEFLDALQLPRYVKLREGEFPAELVAVQRVRHLTAAELQETSWDRFYFNPLGTFTLWQRSVGIVNNKIVYFTQHLCNVT